MLVQVLNGGNGLTYFVQRPQMKKSAFSLLEVSLNMGHHL